MTFQIIPAWIGTPGDVSLPLEQGMVAMKIAIPVWQGRVSPVFDVAQHVLLVELAGDAELARRQTSLPSNQPAQRVRMLGDFGANALICGAISQPLKAALGRSGVEVLDWV